MPAERVGPRGNRSKGGSAVPSFADHVASRRKFLEFLAASPLLAAGGAFAGEGLAPRSKLPDPLMWAPMRADELIKSPKEAINVFDFEPVCRENVPPAHFGYMASGIDDEVTLRANREGFSKFQLRPRRQGRQPPANFVDRHQPRGRGRDRRARPADLVPALRHQQMGGGGGHGEARGEGGLSRGGGDRRPRQRP